MNFASAADQQWDFRFPYYIMDGAAEQPVHQPALPMPTHDNQVSGTV